MGRGKKLSSAEIKVITKLHQENFKIAYIAEKLERSRKVISNFLKDPENYGKKSSPGRPRAVSERDRRAILRVASNSSLTACKIAEQAGVKTNVRNVQKILKESPIIKRKKMKKKPPLTAKHKEDRLKFAMEHVHWKKRWRRVLFTDEKKFNLDGPDGLAYYYHDLRKEESILSRRRHGGGTVMIWAGIGYYGKTDIKFVPQKMDSKKYLDLIASEITQPARENTNLPLIFQQDNAAVHTARIVKKFFSDNNVDVLNWPARSPDMNIIENCWGLLARSAYAENRQYENVDELKQSIISNWRGLPQKSIKKLFKSLPNRMAEIIKKSGGPTHY